MPQFQNETMPNIPEWGLPNNTGMWGRVPHESDSKNSDINAARAFETAREQGFSADVCLAISACVRQALRGQPSEKGMTPVSALRSMEIRQLPVDPAHPDRPNFRIDLIHGTGSKRSLSVDEVFRFHIPTLTGRAIPADIAEDALPEALWDAAMRPTAGARTDTGSQIRLARFSTGRSHTDPVVALYIESPVHTDRYEGIVLAQFPVSRLQLTESEKYLLHHDKAINDRNIRRAEANPRFTLPAEVDTGVDLIVRERAQGKKVDGRSEEELDREIRRMMRAQEELFERRRFVRGVQDAEAVRRQYETGDGMEPWGDEIEAREVRQPFSSPILEPSHFKHREPDPEPTTLYGRAKKGLDSLGKRLGIKRMR